MSQDAGAGRPISPVIAGTTSSKYLCEQNWVLMACATNSRLSPTTNSGAWLYSAPLGWRLLAQSAPRGAARRFLTDVPRGDHIR